MWLRSHAATSPALKLSNATRHNLKNVSVEIPLGRFVVVTGVSGSGKTTLTREVLLPTLEANLRSQISNLKFAQKASERIDDSAEEQDDSDSDSATANPHSAILSGFEHLSRVVLVDQSFSARRRDPIPPFTSAHSTTSAKSSLKAKLRSSAV